MGVDKADVPGGVPRRPWTDGLPECRLGDGSRDPDPRCEGRSVKPALTVIDQNVHAAAQAAFMSRCRPASTTPDQDKTLV